MAKVTYQQAFVDHKILWSIDAASDMTGGYVDQDDLRLLLANPTRDMARDCLERQIRYWLQMGTEDGRSYEQLVREFPALQEIKERYIG